MATSTRQVLSLTLLVAAGLLIGPADAQARKPTPPPPPPDSVLNLSALDMLPKVARRVPPRYPKELRKRGITGEALVEFIVRADGGVTNVEAVRATHPAFAEAAIAAVSEWKFRPGLKDGQPVNCRMQLPIVFALPDER